MTQINQSTHQLERDALGRLVFIDNKGERHVGVHPVRAFPITAPGAGIAIMNQSGKELCWFPNMAAISEAELGLIEKELANMLSQNVQVIWQCGKLYLEDYKKYNSANVQVVAFIERMDLVYAAADIVISRAGASSVSELCIVGKPVIFIPSPNVAEDHQTKNAQAIVDKKGALMLKESELDSQFGLVFEVLLKDQGKQNQLSENIKSLAMPEATKQIVDEIVKLIR